MENTKERSTIGECSLPHHIQHIYEQSTNPRWNKEFHIRRRPVRHSPVPYLPRSRTTNWRGTWGTDTLLQKQQSACESWQNASHGVSSAEQRGQKVATSIMEWSGPGEHWYPKVLRCNTGQDDELQDAHTKHQDEGGNSKQPTKKIANSRWGTNARTIRTTALALCYSTAEYAAPVWERSAYAHLLNPELNQACRAITGCLKPTNIENLYLLAGIAPPEIRRSVCARVERTKQVERKTHSLFGHTPARRCLKSRRSFLTSVQPVHFPAKVVRVNKWKRRLEEKAHATGHDSPGSTGDAWTD